MLRFVVHGIPTPQGSKRGFVIPGKDGRKPRAVVVDDNKAALRTWRQDVKEAAIKALSGGFPLEGPVRVLVDFTLPAPKSLPRRKLMLGAIRKPDLDKLTRATFDAIRDAGVYRDDAQVVDVHARKRFGAPGAVIAVGPATDLEQFLP